mgnify:FL=1
MWVRGCKANGAVHIVNYTIFYNDSLIISYVLIAQLDRVFGYEPKGQGFESLAARQVKSLDNSELLEFEGLFSF